MKFIGIKLDSCQEGLSDAIETLRDNGCEYFYCPTNNGDALLFIQVDERLYAESVLDNSIIQYDVIGE